MKASFDGMRKNATRDMNYLANILQDLLEEYGNYIEIGVKKQLIEKYNNAAQSVDVMNCLYDDSVEDDINDLSNLSVSRLDEEDEE